MRRAAKVDSNQPDIVYHLRKAGATVIITSQLKNAFDLLVCFDGSTYIVEVKDGEKPPSARKLTEGELKCKEAVESAGCVYHVINSVSEAMKLIYKTDIT
jgi:hypothetical protein